MTLSYSVFTHSNWLPETQLSRTVSQHEYERWKKTYTFRAMQHATSYGKDFCEHFDITDFVLTFTLSPDRADAYIKKHYVE